MSICCLAPVWGTNETAMEAQHSGGWSGQQARTAAWPHSSPHSTHRRGVKGNGSTLRNRSGTWTWSQLCTQRMRNSNTVLGITVQALFQFICYFGSFILSRGENPTNRFLTFCSKRSKETKLLWSKGIPTARSPCGDGAVRPEPRQEECSAAGAEPHPAPTCSCSLITES